MFLLHPGPLDEEHSMADILLNKNLEQKLKGNYWFLYTRTSIKMGQLPSANPCGEWIYVYFCGVISSMKHSQRWIEWFCRVTKSIHSVITHQQFTTWKMLCILVLIQDSQPNCPCMTHWGRDKMTAIFRTFSNAFSWMKMIIFRLRFHWNLFPKAQITIFQHRFR